jgi:hypothetical protein
MSGRRLYLALVAGGGAAAGLLVLAAPAGERRELMLGAGLALALQAPLGWAVLTSLGTERFLLVWGAGLLARCGLVGAVAFLVLPVLDWRAAPVLLTLVVTLGVLLGVEAVAAVATSRGCRQTHDATLNLRSP